MLNNDKKLLLLSSLTAVIFWGTILPFGKEVNASPGFLSPWGSRRAITISNPGPLLTNFQVSFTLDTQNLISAGKMRNDCWDIRITDSDETTLINHWVESGCNSASTKIWTKVPSIPASSSKTIYVYYGNPGATSASNGANTFEFFDDFESYAVDSLIHGQGGWSSSFLDSFGRWPLDIRVVNDYAAHGSNSLRGYSDDQWTRPNASRSFGPFNYDVLLQYDVRTTKPTDSQYDWTYYGWRNGAKLVTEEWFYRNLDSPGGDKIASYYDGAFNVLTTYSPDTWYNIKIWLKMSAKKQDIWVDDVKKITDANWSDTTATQLDNFYMQVYGPGPSQYSWVDNIRVRKYASPEPTTSVGAETCDDGDACTSNDQYDGAGNCSGSLYNCTSTECQSPSVCDGLGGCTVTNKPPNTACTPDLNQCTDDVCDGGVCTHPNLIVGTPCSDGNPCTTSDTCNAGACAGTVEVCGNGFCLGGCETSSSCLADCFCGNGVVNAGEACDINGDVGCFAPTPACKMDCSGCISCTIKSNLTFLGKPVICIAIDTIKWVLSIAGNIILLMLIFSGVHYIISGENPERQESAKKMISYAAVGIVLILVSYAVIALIDKILVQP